MVRSGYASVSASSVSSCRRQSGEGRGIRPYRRARLERSSAGRLGSSRIPWGDWRANVCQEVDSVDELHGEEPKLAVGNQVVEGHQIGMGDISQGAELLLEAEQRRGVRPLHGLERDLSVASAVVSLVDDSHAAAAHLAQDHIAHPRQVLFRDRVQR